MTRILLTGGGTGGHIYPLISVAREFKRMAVEKNIDIDLVYCGSYGDFRDTLLSENFPVYHIAGGKFRNYASWLNIFDVFRFGYGLLQAWVKLFFIMPDVIYSDGGPGALPVVLIGRFYRIPVMLHEANAVPGRTNSISARFAVRIGIAFAGAARYFEGKNVALVGNPIRKELIENVPSKEFAKTELGMSHELPLLLVLGGSQGAVRVNDFIFANLDFLIARFQLVHQVGKKNYAEAEAKAQFLLENFTEEERSRYKLVPYFDTLSSYQYAYAAADVVVSRAGAGTIFEIAAFKKPSILIPLPEGEDQRANAYEFAAAGATVVIEQENLLPNLFRAQVEKILGSETDYAAMSEAAGKFSRPDAARAIAEEIIKLVKN